MGEVGDVLISQCNAVTNLPNTHMALKLTPSVWQAYIS